MPEKARKVTFCKCDLGPWTMMPVIELNLDIVKNDVCADFYESRSCHSRVCYCRDKEHIGFTCINNISGPCDLEPWSMMPVFELNLHIIRTNVYAKFHESRSNLSKVIAGTRKKCTFCHFTFLCITQQILVIEQ